MNTAEQIHQQDLERLKLLRYMDDDFMTVCLADNFEGVAAMCKIMEDMRNEKAKEVRIDNALRMIKDGELSLEKIALYSGLSVDEVRELATPVMA